MFEYPKVMPIEELENCYKIACEILRYQKNNWAIGQLYPDGGPDCFTYFFSRRNIPIANYLRGNISMGLPTAYEVNLKNLCQYINWVVRNTSAECLATIKEIESYEAKNWAIGEAYPDGGPDQFVKFFANHDNLPIAPYLRGTVSIGYPTAYAVNIKTLRDYIEVLRSFRCIILGKENEKCLVKAEGDEEEAFKNDFIMETFEEREEIKRDSAEGFMDGMIMNFEDEPELEYEIEFVLEND